MRNIILLLILLIFADKAYCDYTITTTEYTPVQEYYQKYPYRCNYNNKKNFNNRSFDKLERKILRQSYRNENPSHRLNRMEEAVFGAVQSGDTNTRYRALKRALNNNNYQNQNAYYPQRKNRFGNFFNNFSFSQGVPTGFTPPVTNGYYGFNQSPYGVQRNFSDNLGNYHNNSYNLQNGMRIRILD